MASLGFHRADGSHKCVLCGVWVPCSTFVCALLYELPGGNQVDGLRPV